MAKKKTTDPMEGYTLGITAPAIDIREYPLQGTKYAGYSRERLGDGTYILKKQEKYQYYFPISALSADTVTIAVPTGKTLYITDIIVNCRDIAGGGTPIWSLQDGVNYKLYGSVRRSSSTPYTQIINLTNPLSFAPNLIVYRDTGSPALDFTFIGWIEDTPSNISAFGYP